MKTKELLHIYRALFETWHFQVNSHWQRSSFFSAFETVALAACWKLFTQKSDMHGSFALGVALAYLGIVLTLVWFLINERTHKYTLYWLDAVGKVESKIMKASGERDIDFAKKVSTTIEPGLASHHWLERAVPLLFLIAWTALLLFGTGPLRVIGCVGMQPAEIYETVSLIVAIAALLAAVAAAFLAKGSLSQAKRVADRDHNDWKQRKWFDVYFKADEARDALERFQALYPSTSSPGWNTPEWQRESHNLMLIMRTTHRMAAVFPQNQEITQLFEVTAAFEDMGEATSKDRLAKVANAVEGLRQKALIRDLSVLD